MSQVTASLPLRFAQWSLECALRFWPSETRHWGEALAAEFTAIARPNEGIAWALGGMMLFSRALGSYFLGWMKLPAGSGISAGPLPSGSSSFPRLPRFVLALLLLAPAILLCFPRGQESFTSVRSTWNGFHEGRTDLRELDALVHRAEHQKDARALAFAAFSSPDSKRAVKLADQAVAADPNLVWIYPSLVRGPENLTMQPGQLSRLQASDSDNAFVYLMMAEAEFRPGNQVLTDRSIESEKGLTLPVADDAWIDRMHRAFRAPRYDSYARQHQELIQGVWARELSLTPVLLAYAIWSRKMPNLLNLKSYTDLLLSQAKAARIAGDAGRAAQILGEITGFGTLMTKGSSTDFEQVVGLGISRLGLAELRDVYHASGQYNEERTVSAELRNVSTGQTS